MFRRVTLALCLVALVSSAAVYAATTSRLTGEVFDNDGRAMPGVTVQISSDKLIGGPQIAIADGDGRFVFNLLPVGMYTVEASLVGFKPASGQVQVTLDRAAEIVFHMVPEQFGGEIEVSAQVPVVDTAQVNTSVTFDRGLPAEGRGRRQQPRLPLDDRPGRGCRRQRQRQRLRRFQR